MRTCFGLAWASIRHRPGSWLLLGFGFALATVLPVTSAGLRAESSVAAVRSVIDSLPPAQASVLAVTSRDLRGPALTEVDRTVRTGFDTAGIVDRHRTLTFRPLSAGAETFTLGGIDHLDAVVSLTSGRLPQSCQPATCEVVVVTVPGGVPPAASYVRAATELGLVVAGTAELTDSRLTGTGLIASDVPLLVASDPRGLSDLASLGLFGRNTGWYGTLDGGVVATMGAASFTQVLARTAESVNAGSGPLSITWPSAAVAAASARAAAGAQQLAMLGAGSAALLLGFVVVVAAGIRRRQLLVARLLNRRGASGVQQLTFAVLQPLAAVILGTAVGGLIGGVVVAIRSSALFDQRSSAVQAASAAVASQGLTILVLGLVAVVLSVAVTHWPENANRRTQLIADAALVICVAGSALMVRTASAPLGVDADPTANATSTAALIVLVTMATGLVAARLWSPAAWLASRVAVWSTPIRIRQVPTAVAFIGGRRRPLMAMVAAAFVAAACCSLIFAGAYQQSLRRSGADQAASRVPLEVSIGPSAQVAVPADVVDTDQLSAISPDLKIYPVISATVTAFAGSSLASGLPLTGIDLSALPKIHEYPATTGSPVTATDLVDRLSTDRSFPEGPAIPSGTGEIAMAASGVSADVVVSVWVGTDNGREFAIKLRAHNQTPDGAVILSAQLGGLGADSADGRTARRLTVRAVEIAESASFQMHRQHAAGEGANDVPLLTGALKLGTVQADGRPIDWPWTTWGSDQAKVSVAGALLTATFQIGDTRTVLVPGFAALGDAAPLRVAVDPDTAARAGGRDTFGITVNGRTMSAQIAAVLPRLPGVGEKFILADRRAVVSALSRVAPGTAYVGQVWIAAPPRELGKVRSQLAGSRAATATVTFRTDLADSLAADPVAVRSILLLSLSGVVALLLSAVGCAVAVIAQRDDSAAEHLALELDGLAPSGLRGVLLIRAGLVLALGVGVGVLGGLVLAVVAIPLVVTGPGGEAVVPPLRVIVAAAPTLAVVGAALLLGAVGSFTVAARSFAEEHPGMPEVDLR